MTTPIDVLMNLARPSRRPVQDARVEAAQVATLYRTLPGATVTGTPLAVIVAGCYYVYLGSHTILLWLARHLAGKLRYPVVAAYFKYPRASERSGHWARIATRELLMTMAIWGLARWKDATPRRTWRDDSQSKSPLHGVRARRSRGFSHRPATTCDNHCMRSPSSAPERLQRVRESGMSVLFKPASGPALLQALAALPG
jgi:hypothetical protein